MTSNVSSVEGALSSKAAPRSGLVKAIHVMFGATLAAIAFPRALAIPIGGTVIQASDLMCLLTALVWTLAVARRELAVRWDRSYFALAAYFVVAAVSLSVSGDPKHGAIKLLALAYLAAIATMTRSLVHDGASFRFVVGGWLAGWGATVATFVITTLLFYVGVNTKAENPLLTGYYNMPVGPYPRITGLFLNPNMAANYLIVGTFVFIAAVPLLNARWRRLAPWVVGAACISTLFSLSTGFGGLMLAVGVWWWITAPRIDRRYLLRDGALLLGGIGAAAALALATILLLVPAGHGDVRLGPVDLQLAKSGRVVAWSGAVDTVVEHPALGRGYGSLVSWVDHPRAHQSMDNYGSWDPEQSKPSWMEAHSVFLNVAGQTGLLGLAAFVAFYVGILWKLWRGRSLSDTRGWMCWALLAGHLAAILFHGIFAAVEDARQVWFLFGLSLAVPDMSGAPPAIERSAQATAVRTAA
jgi:O-antigen ligase